MLRLKYLYKDTCTWQSLEFLRDTRSHPLVNEHVFHTKKITRMEQEQWYHEIYCQDTEYKIYLVYDDVRQTTIAYVQYYIESLIHRRATVGYVISPEYSKNGYDRKVINLMVKNVKGWEDEIHRLETKILITDEERLHNLTSCGFELDGRIRDYVRKNNEYKDIYVLSLLIGS